MAQVRSLRDRVIDPPIPVTLPFFPPPKAQTAHRRPPFTFIRLHRTLHGSSSLPWLSVVFLPLSPTRKRQSLRSSWPLPPPPQSVSFLPEPSSDSLTGNCFEPSPSFSCFYTGCAKSCGIFKRRKKYWGDVPLRGRTRIASPSPLLAVVKRLSSHRAFGIRALPEFPSFTTPLSKKPCGSVLDLLVVRTVFCSLCILTTPERLCYTFLYTSLIQPYSLPL